MIGREVGCEVGCEVAREVAREVGCIAVGGGVSVAWPRWDCVHAGVPQCMWCISSSISSWTWWLKFVSCALASAASRQRRCCCWWDVCCHGPWRTLPGCSCSSSWHCVLRVPARHASQAAVLDGQVWPMSAHLDTDGHSCQGAGNRLAGGNASIDGLGLCSIDCMVSAAVYTLT